MDRDSDREAKGGQPKTALRKQTVDLDQWLKMDVSEALKPFEEKTLGEIFDFLIEKLGIDARKMKWEVSTADPSNSRKFHLFLDRFRKELEKPTWQQLTPDVVHVKRTFYALEYLVAVHYIFVERFLNKKYRLTRANLKDERDRIKKELEYFRVWENESKDEKNFLSQTTYRVLRTAISGFFAYAEAVLSHFSDLKFVPILHSNTSNIETFFSWVRMMNLDSAGKYGSAVSSQNTISTQRAKALLAKNKMYSAKHHTNEEADTVLSIAEVIKKFEARRTLVSSWKIMSNRTPEARSNSCNLKVMSGSGAPDAHGAWRIRKMVDKRGPAFDHFSQLLQGNSQFERLSWLAASTTQSQRFRFIWNGMNESDENAFDATCRQMMTMLWDDCVVASLRNGNKGYHYHLLKLLGSEKLSTLVVTSMPDALRDGFFGKQLLMVLSNILRYQLIPDAV